MCVYSADSPCCMAETNANVVKLKRESTRKLNKYAPARDSVWSKLSSAYPLENGPVSSVRHPTRAGHWGSRRGKSTPSFRPGPSDWQAAASWPDCPLHQQAGPCGPPKPCRCCLESGTRPGVTFGDGAHPLDRGLVSRGCHSCLHPQSCWRWTLGPTPACLAALRPRPSSSCDRGCSGPLLLAVQSPALP